MPGTTVNLIIRKRSENPLGPSWSEKNRFGVDLKKSKKKLLEYFNTLPDEVAQQLVDFAEFLAARYQVEIDEIPPPETIERPEKESVVAAVKRLSATYPMLDKDPLLDKTSALVTQNLIQGRDAVEVIDELEQVFSESYATLVEEFKQGKAE